ncbi:PilT/PilU family type 4a pilus ATPase [Candidatus Collierbacteria bacterium]|nr:PilT/PilU family type 4a pilus ATPase [Candidatus Collierbacteria bacterium]
MTIQELLDIVIAKDASDLHMVVGSPPSIRVDGSLVFLRNEPLTNDEAIQLINSLLSSEQKDQFQVNRELDLSYQYADKGRFRINAYFQQDHPSAALRLIHSNIKTPEQLRLPQIVHIFAGLKQGFVMVTGPTGHGKSSTLAAIIEEINQTRSDHIVTIEDPIEFVYTPKKSIISQREMKYDTHGWDIALRSVLREDPDVVLVGEMRDYETIAAALTVAETGHLVFATLHTNSAAQTIDRIIDVFPEEQQQQVRQQLAGSLEAVISQRLIPAIPAGRVPATEILLATPAVRNLIREGKSHMIDNVIQTSGALGMMTLENSLAAWVRAGAITLEMAKTYALRPGEIERLVHG